jgi:hypothetical protein
MDSKPEPMTKEQLEAEAAYAEKVFQKYSHPTPQTRRKFHDAITARRHSKAAAAPSQSPAASRMCYLDRLGCIRLRARGDRAPGQIAAAN